MTITIHKPSEAEPGVATFAAIEDTRKIAVLQVTYSLVAGGAERYAFNLSMALRRENFHPMICAVDRGGPLEQELRDAEMPFVIMHRRQGIDLVLMWRLYRLFRASKAKIIHTHHFAQLFYSVLGAKLAGAKIIHNEHGLSAYSKPHIRRALRFLSCFCNAIVVVGGDGEKLLRDGIGIPETKIHVIPGGVNLSAFCCSREEARAALNLRSSDKVATIVARLYPEKNHGTLVSAFAKVRQAVPDARLLIVGEGIEHDAIVHAIESHSLGDCVRLLGVRRDIPQILAASDVFVLSSEREGLPIALLEAMAAGLPVVATNVGDIPSVIENGVDGLLVHPGDTQRLATALIQVFKDPHTAKQMGASARQAVRKFSVDAMAASFKKLYSEALA